MVDWKAEQGQLDLFGFVEDISTLIWKASVQQTGKECRLLNLLGYGMIL